MGEGLMTEHNTRHGLLWCAVWLGILAVGMAWLWVAWQAIAAMWK